MLPIDLTGKRALVAGVSDDGGFGFAIAKALAEAGATICLGSWPPALGIFTKLLERGKMEESMRLSDGRKLEFERIYPLDAAFDTLADAPAEVRENKRYKDVGDFSIQGMAERVKSDFGAGSLDMVVHSLANAPEVKSPLVDTSRQGYLSAISVSAYSNVSLVRHLAPLMRQGGSFLSLTYMADRKSTRLNSSHSQISYAVFCLKKKNKNTRSLSSIHTSLIHLSTVSTMDITITSV